jgi:hypothetical protein
MVLILRSKVEVSFSKLRLPDVKQPSVYTPLRVEPKIQQQTSSDQSYDKFFKFILSFFIYFQQIL